MSTLTLPAPTKPATLNAEARDVTTIWTITDPNERGTVEQVRLAVGWDKHRKQYDARLYRQAYSAPGIISQSISFTGPDLSPRIGTWQPLSASGRPSPYSVKRLAEFAQQVADNLPALIEVNNIAYLFDDTTRYYDR